MSIAQYNTWLESVRTCGECPMLGRGVFVGADSEDSAAEAKNVLFLGLNPGNEEARLGRPFVGPSGRFLREWLAKAGVKRWAMANSLLCSSSNESEIVAADQARACCHANLARIFLHFQPKVLAPCGNGAWSLFKSGMPITPATAEIFISRGPNGNAAPVFVLPMFHPSALIRSGGASSVKFPPFFERLNQIAAVDRMAAQNGVEKALEMLAVQGKRVLECFGKRSAKAAQSQIAG